MKQKKRGLFFNAVLALSFVSMVPVILIGWHVMRVDSRILQTEILEKQNALASRVATVLLEEVNRKVRFFSVFTDLHNDFTGHHFVNQEDIEYLRTKNPEISHISVLNNQGRQIFYSSTEGTRFSYAPELANIVRTCVKEGKEYVGSINRSEERLFVLMAFPVKYQAKEGSSLGVLVAEMDLTALGTALQKVYPKDIEVAVVAGNGSLISYSKQEEGLALKDMPLLRSEIKEMGQSLQGHKSGAVTLEDGESLLVSTASIVRLGWTVYVWQPANAIGTLFLESTFHSVWDLLAILALMVVFVLLVSYLVIKPIVRPVQRLKEVAVKYEEEEEYLPSEKDLIIPNNEIGELDRVFLHMASVLSDRKNALKVAQKKLANLNKDLEQRVQERTNELKRATDKLVENERLAAIGQMASIISHEIRNPLAVISNATRLIKTIEPPTEPKLIKQFSIIDAEIKQANSIISEVLGYARSREMILSLIDLNSYVHDIIASFPMGCDMRIEEDLDPESARLKVDAEEIKQAIRNLISNACEAMPNGGTVRVGTRVGRTVVCIYVQDEGPGISKEILEKVFSPFFTTKARGTGLGLAVVRKAVARHKGKLFIHSQENKGTCFAIYLRIYKKAGDTKYG